MGQVLHKRATTTFAIRAKIQESEESNYALAKKYNIDKKTVKKWKSRDFVSDEKMGTKSPKSSLTSLEQQVICEFRRSTKFSLDDCYIALKKEIPKLTRSNLHRVLQKNNLSKFPKEIIAKQKFENYEIGFVHVDITFLNINKQKYYLFVAIERLSKLLFLKLYRDKTIETSAKFLQEIIDFFPFKIHRILTDNGAEFTYKSLQNCKKKEDDHEFNKICLANNIVHKTTQFAHPWTNGQIEIMNKQIKNNTTRKYFYDSFEQLSNHLNQYMVAYNLAKQLKSLKFKTPYQKVVDIFEEKRDNFKCGCLRDYFVGLYK